MESDPMINRIEPTVESDLQTSEHDAKDEVNSATNMEDKPKIKSSIKIPLNETPGRQKLRQWLNRSFRIVMTDGRTLIGEFLCTDSDANVILSMCSEYTQQGESERFLGLVMVPGRHIVTMEVDNMYRPNNKN